MTKKSWAMGQLWGPFHGGLVEIKQEMAGEEMEEVT